VRTPAAKFADTHELAGNMLSIINYSLSLMRSLTLSCQLSNFIRTQNAKVALSLKI